MSTIEVSQFQAQCLSLVDQVAATGEDLVVTRNGRAIAKLVAIDRPGVLLGRHAGVMDLGDIVSPIDVDWGAERSDSQQFASVADLRAFFAETDERAGAGRESDWHQHRSLIDSSKGRGATDS